MDPVLGTVVVSFIASAGAVVVAIIAGRNSAVALNREDLIRRLRREITRLGGNPDDV